MSEKLVSVAEVTNVQPHNIPSPNRRVYYDGYEIKTSHHVYSILIDNDQNCCENWGYFVSEDEFDRFIGKELICIELTDMARNRQRFEDTCVPLDFLDCGGVQFVDFKFADGDVLQFAVYNEHNGCYGHPIMLMKDMDILYQDKL